MLEDFNVMSHNLMTMLIAIDSNDNEFNARRFRGDVVEPELDDYDKYDHEEFEVMRFHSVTMKAWSLPLYRHIQGGCLQNLQFKI